MKRVFVLVLALLLMIGGAAYALPTNPLSHDADMDSFQLKKVVLKKKFTAYTDTVYQLALDIVKSESDAVVRWSSSNKKIMKVDAEGIATTFKKAGRVTITARGEDGRKVKCKVTVKKRKAIKSLRLNLAETSLSVGAEAKLYAQTVSPAIGFGEPKLSWSSSDASVVSVAAQAYGSHALIKGVRAGTATVTARTSNGKKASCLVTVSGGGAPVPQSPTQPTEPTPPPTDLPPTVIQPKTALESAKALSTLLRNDDVEAGLASGEAFAFKRLLVQTKGTKVDFSAYNPTTIIDDGDGFFILQFATVAAAKTCCEKLNNRADIEFAEADWYLTSQSNIRTRTMPLMVTSDQSSSSHLSWGAEYIEADEYAGYIRNNVSGSVTVAVVDSGIDMNHAFLKQRLLHSGIDFYDGDDNPTDECGHGTHVAGIIVDCTPNLNVFILPIRVLGPKNDGSASGLAKGIRYAADNGADVINCSTALDLSSFSGWWDTFTGSNGQKTIHQAIDYAIDRGSVVIVPSGNEDQDTENSCPSDMDRCITVASIWKDYTRAGGSNYGSSVDVTAPGHLIRSSVPKNLFGEDYITRSGTSMAVPHVAAIAAMFKLRYPSRTPAQIKAMIKACAIPLPLGSSGWNKYCGEGVPMPITTMITGISLNKTSVTHGWWEQEKWEQEKLVISFQPSNISTKRILWTSSDEKVVDVRSDGTLVPYAAGTATITAKTINNLTASCVVTVTPMEIVPESISLDRYWLSLGVDDEYTLRPEIYPPDAVNKTVAWSSDNEAVATVSANGKVTAKAPGNATITAETFNRHAAYCNVTVAEPVQPTPPATIPSPRM